MTGICTWRRRALVAALLLALTLPGTALAHASIDVGDGRYVLELGFRDEPAYLGLPNAVYLKAQEYATGGTRPVDGLAATLTVEVSKDGETMTVPLAPTGEGEYEGVFVPTATGDYTFRIFGTIGDAEVDESVSSGPNTFASIAPLSAIEFPVPRPDPGQAQAEAAEVAAAASMARTLAMAGIAAGMVGAILGAFALARAGRTPRPAVAAPAASESAVTQPSGKLIR